MNAILGLFDLTKVLRMGMFAAGLLAAWGAWLWQHDGRVVEKERARVEQKANENAAKANAARRGAEQLPSDRLRDRYCRDCR